MELHKDKTEAMGKGIAWSVCRRMKSYILWISEKEMESGITVYKNSLGVRD
jgi:hypothetical protein